MWQHSFIVTCCQVELTEYVKLADSVYRVENNAHHKEDPFTHDRVINFQVCTM